MTYSNFQQKLKNFDNITHSLPKDRDNFFNYFSYAQIKNDVRNDAYDFCEDNFHDNWIWDCVLGGDITTIFFKNTEDLLIFKLKFLTI
jgi:hypothetical protein